MNGFEIGCIILSVALYLIWLSTPPALSVEERKRKEAIIFRENIRNRYLAVEREKARRARQKEAS